MKGPWAKAALVREPFRAGVLERRGFATTEREKYKKPPGLLAPGRRVALGVLNLV